jgi:RNA polymerase sigma-70 factor (ECF subfamily)
MKNDQELISGYLAGDEDALEELIRRHIQPVYTFIYRYVGSPDEAQDILQDVFIRVWKNIKKYNPTKSFRVWIFTIAKNASLDWIKKKKAVPFSAFEMGDESLSFEDTLATPEPNAEELLEKDYSEEVLAKAMSSLTPVYRNVLVLRSTGLMFKEISEVVGKPLDTVKSQYRRALESLKKVLSDTKTGI